jgi:DNA-binding IclR family transcriptional regulator
MTGATEKNLIKSIVKAAAVIDILVCAESPLALISIAKQIGIAKSTLHGILTTLVEVGYVAQDPDTGFYKPGMHLFELGNLISQKIDVLRISKPYMQEISQETGETVHLAVLEDGEVLYIGKQESNSSIRIVTEAGLKLPAHCTGVGKALLAGLDKVKIKSIVRSKGLAQYTDTTITTLEGLLSEIDNVKGNGYATDQQEFMVGLRCVAIPIFDHNGSVVCAISISGPISRMGGDIFEFKKKRLMKAAAEISAKLGYVK